MYEAWWDPKWAQNDPRKWDNTLAENIGPIVGHPTVSYSAPQSPVVLIFINIYLSISQIYLELSAANIIF